MRNIEKELADIIAFKEHIEKLLDKAFDEGNLEPLYEQDFILSFMGKSCRIAFGAETYNNLIDYLENTINEY